MGDADRILAVAARWRAESRILESVVAGGSMGVALTSGSRIRIQLSSRLAYDPGEVIAILPESQFVVHRVTTRARGRGRGHVLTRGDSVVVPDPPVELRRVLGPVTEVEGAGGWGPVPPLAPGSFRGRWARRVVLAATATVLFASPRAARRVIDVLRRLEDAVRARPR